MKAEKFEHFQGNDWLINSQKTVEMPVKCR